MINSLSLTAITTAVCPVLDDASVDSEVRENILGVLNNTSLFSGLKNPYQQHKYYKKNFGLVVTLHFCEGITALL